MALEKFVHLTEYNPYHGAGGKFASKGNAKMTVRQGHGGPSAGRSGKAWASALEKRYGGAERAPAPRGKRGKVDSGVQSGGTGDYDFTTGAVRSMVAAGGSRRLAQDLVDMHRPSSGGARARRAAKLDHEQAANGFARERAKKMAAGGDRVGVPQKLDKYTRPMSDGEIRPRRTAPGLFNDHGAVFDRLPAAAERAKGIASQGSVRLAQRRDEQYSGGGLKQARSRGHTAASQYYAEARQNPKGSYGRARMVAAAQKVATIYGPKGKSARQAARVQVPQKLDKYTQPMSKADRRGSLERATYGMNHPERLTPLGVLRGMKKVRQIQADRGKTPRQSQRDFQAGRGATPMSSNLHARAATLFKLARRAPKGVGRTKKKAEALEYRMVAKDRGVWEKTRGSD